MELWLQQLWLPADQALLADFQKLLICFKGLGRDGSDRARKISLRFRRNSCWKDSWVVVTVVALLLVTAVLVLMVIVIKMYWTEFERLMAC